VRRQAKRDAAFPLTQKRRRASLAAAFHDCVSGIHLAFAGPPWISESAHVGGPGINCEHFHEETISPFRGNAPSQRFLAKRA
jgi:hypothetical protein